MVNKTLIRFVAVVTALLLTCAVSNKLACAVGSSADYMTVDSITICERYGIVEGEGIELTASLMPETALKSSVKWRSSNEGVVSCTEDGFIKGITPGGYAYIYCESNRGDVSDKIKVYCVEKVSHTVRSDLKGYFNFIYSAPEPLAFLALHVNVNGILKLIFEAYYHTVSGFNSASTVNAARGAPLAMGKCEIKGKHGSYAYISFKSGEIERDGFIRFSKFEGTAGLYPTLSAKDINVWGDGVIYESKTLTTKYVGDITWKVADDTVVEFNNETGQLKGLKPGVTTITATTSDGFSETCTVHSLYKWPQTWTTQTNRDTYLYRADGSGYKEDKALIKGKSFVVYGDEGGSDGWAYGKISGTETWGFIPISHVSTKGTVSQYSGLGWAWSLQNTEYNYIYSPFAPRSSENDEHRGIDINEKTNQADIEGQPLVAAFDGVVKDVGYHEKAGYYVCLLSNDKDFITGENLVAIYMHMNQLPPVSIGTEVKKGETPIGCVGNTGRSGGSHLHFEVNNINAGVYDSIRHSYVYTINPIYFYMNKNLMFNNSCSAVKDGYGFYWYNKNKE